MLFSMKCLEKNAKECYPEHEGGDRVDHQLSIHTQTLNIHTYNDTQEWYAEHEVGDRVDHHFNIHT
jgi:hypothetical protein